MRLPLKHSIDVTSELLAERTRQVEKGYTTELDDSKYPDGQLAMAAAAYAHPQKMLGGSLLPRDFGWNPDRPYRDKLVIAAALIIAEIERIDRLKAQS